MRNFNVIDLFSGCGGFSYGFEQAGFNVILGVDNWDLALETFQTNHKNSSTLNLDLHDKDSIKKIIEFVQNKRVDVIIAGPPCQGFSLTGTRNKEDRRNSLFESVFELAKELNVDSPEIIASCTILKIPATSKLSILSVDQCKEIIDYLKKN